MQASRMASFPFVHFVQSRSVNVSVRSKMTCYPVRASFNPLPKRLPSTMSAWQIYDYGGVDKLTLSDSVHLPIVQRPDDVLVEVHAASVNPIDIAMLGGYGSNAINFFRRINGTLKNGSEFPLTLGRDFSGHIVDVGKNVDRKKFKIGDEVWGAGNVAYPGAFALYQAVSSKEISLKPKILSHIEAGSMPYVIGTTWAAIHTVGQFNDRNLRGKRVLVLGASGGIGTFAIQLLKAWGANVMGTCSTDAVNKVVELGVHTAVDYTQPNVWEELKKLGKFDFIFDTVGGPTSVDNCIKLLHTGAMYVTIITPFLKNTDSLGVLQGTVKTIGQIGALSCKTFVNRRQVRWALFMPSGEAMHTVAKLVDNNQIVPVVEKVFPLSELPAAFKKVAAKHNRGKTVIDMKETGDK